MTMSTIRPVLLLACTAAVGCAQDLTLDAITVTTIGRSGGIARESRRAAERHVFIGSALSEPTEPFAIGRSGGIASRRAAGH